MILTETYLRKIIQDVIHEKFSVDLADTTGRWGTQPNKDWRSDPKRKVMPNKEGECPKFYTKVGNLCHRKETEALETDYCQKAGQKPWTKSSCEVAGGKFGVDKNDSDFTWCVLDDGSTEDCDTTGIPYFPETAPEEEECLDDLVPYTKASCETAGGTWLSDVNGCDIDDDETIKFCTNPD
jgi:hypothetical protein